MPSFDIAEKRTRINIFKLSGAYYFKHFFDNPLLFGELEPFYDKLHYRFKMATAGRRNKVMKLLDRKGYDPTIIEDPAPFTVEISIPAFLYFLMISMYMPMVSSVLADSQQHSFPLPGLHGRVHREN